MIQDKRSIDESYKTAIKYYKIKFAKKYFRFNKNIRTSFILITICKVFIRYMSNSKKII